MRESTEEQVCLRLFVFSFRPSRYPDGTTRPFDFELFASECEYHGALYVPTTVPANGEVHTHWDAETECFDYYACLITEIAEYCYMTKRNEYE